MVGLRIADGEILYDNDLDAMIAGIKSSAILHGFQVLATGTPDMQVHVQVGDCRTDDGTLITKSSITDLTVAANSSGNPRKDIVVMNNSGTISIVQGTPAPEVGNPSPTPFPPDIPASSIILAQIYVANGATSITNSNIADKRVFQRYIISQFDTSVQEVYPSTVAVTYDDNGLVSTVVETFTSTGQINRAEFTRNSVGQITSEVQRYDFGSSYQVNVTYAYSYYSDSDTNPSLRGKVQSVSKTVS